MHMTDLRKPLPHCTMRKTSLTIVLVTYVLSSAKKRPINCHGLRTKGLIEFLTSNILFFSLVITYFFFQVQSSNLFFGKVYAICYVLQVTYLTMSVVGVHNWGQMILKMHLNCCDYEVSQYIIFTTSNQARRSSSKKDTMFGWLCPNISTTPITAMRCRLCLPFSVVKLER